MRTRLSTPHLPLSRILAGEMRTGPLGGARTREEDEGRPARWNWPRAAERATRPATER